MIQNPKEFFSSTARLIVTVSKESVKQMIDGVAKGDAKKTVLSSVVLLALWVLPILAGVAVVKLAFQNRVTILAVGILAAAAFSVLQKLFHIEPPEPPHKPTEEDYQAALTTIRSAVATVAQALGLAPVYGHTDMEADPEEHILPWGKVWRLKYKVLKQNISAQIDTDLARRVIQAQVKTVLERGNPSGFAAVRFAYGGTFLPVILVDEVKDGDAYIYIFAVITSAEYLQQKRDWENRKDTLLPKADTDDEDF